MGKKVQGTRSINGRYTIDRGMLRIVWEMEKPKNLHVHQLSWGECWWEEGYRVEGNKEEKKMGKL